MKSAAATVVTTVEASREKTFLHIVPIDLTTIFTGFGPLPSVTGSLNQTGPWDAAGRSRTVVFSDGSSARETLTNYEYPSRFAYRITEFTGVLRFLATEARGEWWFESVPGRSATSVRWRYEFISRSILLKPLVSLFTRSLWRGYMRKALYLSKAQVEAPE
ncbi:SRPBCC family protein [Polaromonas aquatica]|uniref:SRPBCC family protein n=1 Tax=Polaromonas aquatica TaxID=332657 RepID=UPI003D64F85D